MDEPLSTDQEIRIEALKAAAQIEASLGSVMSNMEAAARNDKFWLRVENFENYIRNGKES